MVEHRRTIKSYVVRSGRMTPGQEKAFQKLWSLYGVEANDQQLDFQRLYGRQAPVILEIGFGMGDSLIEMAAQYPQNNYLGIEVHKPGVGRLLGKVSEQALTNLRVMQFDAIEVLKNQIPDASLSAVYLYFPDPWHKKRHHKRRIVQPAFVQMICTKLKTGGLFHLATDWENYAEHMMEVMTTAEGFENTAGKNKYTPKPDYRPVTKFEQRGHKLGHGVWDLIFKKVA